MELLALLFGKFVLALPFLEPKQRNCVVFGKPLDGSNELAGDRLHHVRGSYFMTAVDADELQGALDSL